MSDFEIRANQPAAQGAGFTPEEPEGDEKTPKKKTETNTSIHLEALSQNGLKGVAAKWQTGKTFKGNVFDKTITGNVELGNFTGAGAEFKLSKPVTNEISLYGSMGLQGRVALNDVNTATAHSEANTYYTVYPQLGNDIPPYENSVHAEVIATKSAPKNDMNGQVSLGARYEGEDGYLDVSVNAGVNGQILPTAFASANIKPDVISIENHNYDVIYDSNGQIIQEIEQHDFDVIDNTKIVTTEITGVEGKVTPYLGGAVEGGAKLTPNLSAGLKLGVQVNPVTDEVRPEIKITGNLSVSGLVNDIKKKK